MAWLFLLVAGLCEVAWAIGLKYTEGFSRFVTHDRHSRRHGGQYWFPRPSP